MRAAAIFGLGTSPGNLESFRSVSATEWLEGVPSSSADADAILIFGGDGTIHRHLPALVRLGLPVLVVPAGSGNDFARALKLRSAQDSLKAWQAFEAGRVTPQAIDLGLIVSTAAQDSPHYFCCVAGCGLDSVAAERANRMPRWLRGHGGYALALLPALLGFRAISMSLISIGGIPPASPTKPTLVAAFANTRYYGDGMQIAPEASMTDGMLDICRVSALSAFKLFCMFPTVYFGHHLSMPEVEYWKAERVRLQTERPLAVYADGEFVCETPVEIEVARAALRVITLQPVS